MQKNFKLFIITSLMALSAMQLHAGKPKEYVLDSYFKAERANLDILLVKEIPDTGIIVFDREARGEIFKQDEKSDEKKYTSVKKLFGLPEGKSLDNVFSYKDSDGTKLLVGFQKKDNELYLFNLNKERSYVTKLYLGYNFKLYQNNDNSLFTLNLDNGALSMIYPEWKLAEKQYEHPEKVLLENKFLGNLSDTQVTVKNEGAVVCLRKYKNQYMKIGLDYVINSIKEEKSEYLFDTESLTKEAKDIVLKTSVYEDCEDTDKKITRIHPQKIWSYHKTADGRLILGHGLGLVSIWKPKE